MPPGPRKLDYFNEFLAANHMRCGAVQARKEGKMDELKRLEICMKTAMEEKQKTLRPEIQLLNKLIAADSSDDRRKVHLCLPISYCISVLSTLPNVLY